MSIQKILLTGAIGGIIALGLGALIFGIGLASIADSLSGSATGVMKGPDEFLWIPMIVGHVAFGVLFAYIFGRWANISTFSGGAQGGAIIGFLVICSTELINLGSTNIYNSTGTIVNIVLGTIFTAIMGGIIGLLLGRMNK